MARMMAIVIAAAVLLPAADAAWADSCETFPGSQVYTDQGCDKPYENKAAPKQATPAPVAQNPNGLREQLRRSLSSAGSGASNTTGTKPSADQINQRVVDARAKIDAALADPNAPGAKQRYDVAVKELHGAYADAAKAYPNQADLFQRFENQDSTSAAARVANTGWDAPTTVDAAPAKPAGPDNVIAAGTNVYVCDGAIAGANNVSCREISADGRQCTGVTLADGGVGWRDSIATPCRSDDMAQRKDFLAANPDAAAAGRAAPPGFAMSSDETAAEIRRLTAEPPPVRAVDDGEKNEWNQAMADPAAPTVDDASAATPMDVASNSDSDGGNSGHSGLDDAIDILNAATSLLGAASALSTPSYSAPTPSFRPPPVRTSAPSIPAYRQQAPSSQSTITGGN